MPVAKIEDELKRADPAYSTSTAPPSIPYGQATLGGFKGEVPAGMTRRQWEALEAARLAKELRRPK
jgi:hypothetical protein